VDEAESPGSDDPAAAAEALARSLGAAEPGAAEIAALERLNELRIAGACSEADYLREKRRLLSSRPATGSGPP
jgi:hypothetical protein